MRLETRLEHSLLLHPPLDPLPVVDTIPRVFSWANKSQPVIKSGFVCMMPLISFVCVFCSEILYALFIFFQNGTRILLELTPCMEHLSVRS